MKKLKKELITQYVEKNIGVFHKNRILKLNEVSLDEVLKKKNPYLFKSKNVITASEIVKGILDAFLSSSEEGLFGNWLEGLAIFINKSTFGGRKSGIAGIDLEFDKSNVRYIINIKSGPNWCNGSQLQKMKTEFIHAKKALRTGNSGLTVIAINGCCYGKDSKSDKGDYLKLCGQEFWEFISGIPSLYIDIIEPLGYKAKEKNEEFLNSYASVLNKFTNEFYTKFCDADGNINWIKIVQFNSGKKVKILK